VVFADVRGRGDSDGIFQPYRHDGPDGAEVIAWTAAQEWCSGDVATWGASYGGRIQWLTALEPVPFITSASSAQIGGPDDYLGVESRGDVLVFTSDPLTACPAAARTGALR